MDPSGATELSHHARLARDSVNKDLLDKHDVWNHSKLLREQLVAEWEGKFPRHENPRRALGDRGSLGSSPHTPEVCL